VKTLRTLTFALVILAAIHLIAATIETRATLFFLERAGFGGFIPLSLAAAAGVTSDKSVLVATLLGVLLAVLPCSVAHLAHALTPLGLGVAAGVAICHGIRESKEEQSGEPVHGSSPHRD
jgi:hypothetical protein